MEKVYLLVYCSYGQWSLQEFPTAEDALKYVMQNGANDTWKIVKELNIIVGYTYVN